ncbi:uncharacterized protein RB166_002126 [Leptodactylus fuscus]
MAHFASCSALCLLRCLQEQFMATKGEATYQSTVLTVTTSASQSFVKSTPAFIQTKQTDSTTTNTEEPEVAPTQDPGPRLDLPDSNLSPFSHQPETSSISQLPQNTNSEISETSKQNKNINDIFADDDDDDDDTLSSINERTTSPEIENTVKDVSSVSVEPVITTSSYEDTEAFLEDTSKIKEHDGSVGLEPWKVGVISIAAFLAIEAMVFALYCFICTKKRNVNIVKNGDQDSEAAVTINVESNSNTVLGEDGTINE